MIHKYQYFSTVVSLFVFLYTYKHISEQRGYETIYYDVQHNAGIVISDVEIERPKDGFVKGDHLLLVWIPPISKGLKPLAEIRATCRLTDETGLYEYKRPINLASEWIKDEFKPILALESKFKNIINLKELRYCVRLKTDPHTYIPVSNSKIIGKDARLEIGIIPKYSGYLQWKIIGENNYKSINLSSDERTSISIELRDLKKEKLVVKLKGRSISIIDKETKMPEDIVTFIIPKQ